MKPTYGYCRTKVVEKLVGAIEARGGFAYAPFYMDYVIIRGKRRKRRVYPFGDIVFFAFKVDQDFLTEFGKYLKEWTPNCIRQHEIDTVKELNDSGAYDEGKLRAAALIAKLNSLVGKIATIENPIHAFCGRNIEIREKTLTGFKGDILDGDKRIKAEILFGDLAA